MKHTGKRWIKIEGTTQAQMKQSETGTVLAVRQNGLPKICLSKTEQGWFALKDKCPHQGAELSGGKCTPDGFIECPRHKFLFDMQTGREKRNEGDSVETYPLRENEGNFEIGLRKKWWQVF